MRYQWLLAIPLLLTCGLAMPQAMPANADSEYFRTLGCGTLLNKNVVPTDIVFHLELKVKKTLPPKAVIVVEFENPTPNAAPIEVILDPAPDKKELSISSPGMACLTNNKYLSHHPDIVRRLKPRQNSKYACADHRNLHAPVFAQHDERPIVQRLLIRDADNSTIPETSCLPYN